MIADYSLGLIKVTLICLSVIFAGWSLWSEWSVCSNEKSTVACGYGAQNRTRECMGNTSVCEGSLIETRYCQLPPCNGKKEKK